MARIKYYYNTETCKYERVVTQTSDVVLNTIGFLILSLLFAGGLMFFYFKLFDSPKEALLKEENQKLKSSYEDIHHEFENVSRTIASLQSKDNEIYRIIFEAEPVKPIDSKVKISHIDKIQHLLGGSFVKEDLVTITLDKLTEIKADLASQDKSFNELLVLAHHKEEMLASIPAIQPISNKTLKKLASGFGMRIHPIYKVKKMHTGIDFAAVRGTPVYATGNGKIQIATHEAGEGYGNCIEVEHGFGFMTRYAHLQKIKAKNGQIVKRGEIIGYVGSTGTSTSPHLHYEVHKHGRPVDPINFFFNDLTPREYEELIKLSEVENQSLGGETATVE